MTDKPVPVRVTDDLVRTLADVRGGAPLVSICFPVEREPAQFHQNDVRLRNLARAAKDDLAGLNVSPEAADRLLEPVTALAGDERAWGEPEAGRAIFLCDGECRQVSLADAPPELGLAGDRFHLKPLFGSLPQTQGFYVLALSQNEVALFHGDGAGLTRVDFEPGTPTSLEDVAGHERTDPQLQHHAADRGSDEAIFHGHGGGKDDTDAELEKFLRKVADVLERHTQPGVPVILAGVEHVLAGFRRQAAQEDDLLDDQIAGNVEHLTTAALHDKAWPLIARRLHTRRKAMLERLGSGDPAVEVRRELGEVIRAGKDGRIEELFVARDAECWGHYDESERKILTHDDREPGDCDLLDEAAVASFQNGGRVHAVAARDLPGGHVSVARLRY